MSRVGKKPIPIADKIKVDIDGQNVTVTGPRGTLSRTIHPDVSATVEDNAILVTRPSDQKRHRALHGLTRALLNNMVLGVATGFRKELVIVGIGYRAEMRGKNLVMQLGYSHPIVVAPPDNITLSVLPKENKVIVDGIDKELVGEVAAKIRNLRKPEPYKGKGIRYADEQVRTKAGKVAASA